MAGSGQQASPLARRRTGGVAIHVPPAAVADIPWPVWRVASSGRFGDSLHTILNEWTLTNVYEANQIIDALLDAEARAAQEK